VVEAWVSCSPTTKRGGTAAKVRVILNRTPSLATILAASYPDVLVIEGCGLDRQVKAPSGNYNVTVGVISPYVELATDGKEPALSPFSEAIAEALSKACRAAHRAMEKPPGGMSFKDAAWLAMPDAYDRASGGGEYPANARQIMYAARPRILELTGKAKLADQYFTQVLLPDYLDQHPEETSDWDVVFDARGNFVEPHTNRDIPLGTLEVRQYLGERPSRMDATVTVEAGTLSPTTGPEHRYSNILFVEKQGFGPLLDQARIAERFDVSIMSTKGVSVTAARLLLDRLAPRIDKVIVIHDFDVSGFTIFGTLGSDGRRYSFENEVPLVDAGLRLSDVVEMDLQSEPVEISGDWDTRAATLFGHGATREEINFLENYRVELNEMPADVFVAFVERKLTEHGVRKVVPDDSVLVEHARSVMARDLINKEISKVRDKAVADAAAVVLPADLRERLRAVLKRQPDVPWDVAVADIALAACRDDGTS